MFALVNLKIAQSPDFFATFAAVVWHLAGMSYHMISLIARVCEFLITDLTGIRFIASMSSGVDL